MYLKISKEHSKNKPYYYIRAPSNLNNINDQKILLITKEKKMNYLKLSVRRKTDRKNYYSIHLPSRVLDTMEIDPNLPMFYEIDYKSGNLVLSQNMENITKIKEENKLLLERTPYVETTSLKTDTY